MAFVKGTFGNLQMCGSEPCSREGEQVEAGDSCDQPSEWRERERGEGGGLGTTG